DDVPASSPKGRFELLDDLAVAANRAVEPLQVAVHDEDEIVELLARGQRQRSERFRLIRFSIPQECPNMSRSRRNYPAILQIPHEAGLIDGVDRTETHRHRRKLPETWHKPWVRVRGQSGMFSQLMAKILQMLISESSFQVRTGVFTG